MSTCSICDEFVLPAEDYKIREDRYVHIECFRKQHFRRVARSLLKLDGMEQRTEKEDKAARAESDAKS